MGAAVNAVCGAPYVAPGKMQPPDKGPPASRSRQPSDPKTAFMIADQTRSDRTRLPWKSSAQTTSCAMMRQPARLHHQDRNQFCGSGG